MGERQWQVYSALRILGNATDKDLAKYLGWPINCVTPRRFELVKEELVMERSVITQDGRNATLWCLT